MKDLPVGISELKEINITNLKVQELGLNLLLMNLAQQESLRIKKLYAVIDKLEDYIFDPSIIEHLSPNEQMQRYELALKSTQSSSTYIKDAIKNVNWSDIETKIMLLSQESTLLNQSEESSSNSQDLQKAALMLLQKLSQEK